eukprot:TRINITY_DN20278_c0_g1_i2.p1 TRINITY_DN20278_c0_g1~~TRINITY_DN20278_c0_g1_i2.p1  ORF type:complete len:389 (-),score=52.22 TRINITY_DN20278_c0_g1_i2:36-1202(-)
MRFWTVGWIAIGDWRLGLAYYLGVALVLVHAIYGVIINRGYLEFDPVRGICRPQLQPDSSSKAGVTSCRHKPCRHIPTAEIEAGLNVGQVFIATHVKESVERCSDMFCLEADREMIQNSDFYALGVEDYVLSISCNAQAFRFFSEDCQNQIVSQASPSLLQPTHLRGTRANGTSSTSACHFSTANLDADGRLLGPSTSGNTKTMAAIPAGTGDSFVLRKWLEAAGVSLEDLSDAPGAANAGKTLRQTGLVLVVNIMYHNQPVHRTVSDYFFTPELGEIEYDIEVQRVAESDYVAHKATVQENVDGGSSLRELKESSGIFIQFVQGGQLGRFSWAALADQIVLKLGLLSLVQLLLDLFWQHALPFFGADYNKQVFNRVVRLSQGAVKAV